MIEEIFHEEYGLVAARRAYDCKINEPTGEPWAHVVLLPSGMYAHRSALARLTIEVECYECGRRPLLWDHARQDAYVLVPFVIMEEPW